MTEHLMTRDSVKSKTSPPPTILVIDDEKAFCHVVCEILDSFGYQSHEAYNATEALSYLEESTPNMILTDVMMPDIDGLDLISTIRSNDRFSSTPIIVVSAKATPEDRKAALLVGANSFLAKPFSSQELMEIVRPFFPSA